MVSLSIQHKNLNHLKKTAMKTGYRSGVTQQTREHYLGRPGIKTDNPAHLIQHSVITAQAGVLDRLGSTAGIFIKWSNQHNSVFALRRRRLWWAAVRSQRFSPFFALGNSHVKALSVRLDNTNTTGKQDLADRTSGNHFANIIVCSLLPLNMSIFSFEKTSRVEKRRLCWNSRQRTVALIAECSLRKSQFQRDSHFCSS